MILSKETAMEVIKNPKSKKQIQSAKQQESQLRVFTEDMSKEELDGEAYWNDMLTKMKARSDKKFPRVIQFARFPLPVVQLCDSVLSDYFRVFEGKNRYFNAEGDRDLQRLNLWIKESKATNWIENHAKEVFKNKPNSFVVIDRDSSGNPYLVFVDSKRLIDAKFKDDKGNLEYICFIHSQENHPTQQDVITTFFSVYDDVTYYVFSKDSNSDSLTLISESTHGIGYCPAKAFISSPSNHKNIFKRRVAFTSALSKLEDWTIFDIFRNYVDHYAPFPVTEAPMRKCANADCQDGKVSEEVVTDVSSGATKTTWSDCQVCGGSDGGQHIYPGTHIGIKVQSDKSMNDGSGVFKMIFPDVDKLKYIPEKLDDIELEVRLKTVGVNNMNSEAFNEMQVKGSFASMESILLRTKTEMDELYIFIIKTVARIMYKDISVNVEANFGTEFYLISEEDLQSRFKTAKEIGLPVEEQLNIYKQIIETKYKGDGGKLERVKMLLDLDPYPMNSIKECVELKNESVLDDFQLSLKVNFLKFISKFENENTLITEFGKNLEYKQRIEIIQFTLEQYNSELIESKNNRNNPKGKTEGGGDEPAVTQEQLDAQANLRGTVGGVQGILGILQAVASGTQNIQSAIATMNEIYGFNEQTAIKILGVTSNKTIIKKQTDEKSENKPIRTSGERNEKS